LIFRAIRIANRVLRNRTHLARHPAGQDFPALLFAEARAVEVAFDDEGDNVDDELVFVENGVDDDGDHGREEVAAEDFDHDHDEAAGLEDSAGK
jgi:hypothetical protein